MGHGHQLDVKRPKRKAAAERHHGDRNFGRARFTQALGFEQRGGERRRIDRHLEPRPEVDEGAEMILVPMREHEPEEILSFLDQKADIGEDKVDAGEVIARK